MDAERNQAMNIIAELPEPYIVYALEILKNVRQMSSLGMAAKKDGFPTRLHERKNSKEIQEAIEVVAGALPNTDMMLADFREERLGKYADIA